MNVTATLIHWGGKLVPPSLQDKAKHYVKWEVFSERILENPLVIQNLPKKPSVILDVGSRYSQVPLEMAALGHTVYALDIDEYAFQHNNLTFIKEDIRKTSFKKNFFDVVTIISTIEHVGLGEDSYGDAEHKDGDIEAMQEIRRILKPKGIVLLTIPFGKENVLPFMRIYDKKQVEKMARGFTIVSAQYMKKEEESWVLCSYNDVKNVVQTTNHTRSNAFYILRKK